MADRTWTYRFTRPDETEVETTELADDAAAEARGRQLSTSSGTVVVIHRHSAHVEAWEYVTEVDERS